jgi:aspartate ammonia-lyase
MNGIRKEMDSLGEVNVPASKLRGAQTQRSLEHLSIGKELMPREMITAYATLKKAAANANHFGGRLNGQAHKLIVHVCGEILTASIMTCSRTEFYRALAGNREYGSRCGRANPWSRARDQHARRCFRRAALSAVRCALGRIWSDAL